MRRDEDRGIEITGTNRLRVLEREVGRGLGRLRQRVAVDQRHLGAGDRERDLGVGHGAGGGGAASPKDLSNLPPNSKITAGWAYEAEDKSPPQVSTIQQTPRNRLRRAAGVAPLGGKRLKVAPGGIKRSP